MLVRTGTWPLLTAIGLISWHVLMEVSGMFGQMRSLLESSTAMHLSELRIPSLISVLCSRKLCLEDQKGDFGHTD